jgi:hypothetical protein
MQSTRGESHKNDFRAKKTFSLSPTAACFNFSKAMCSFDPADNYKASQQSH